MELRNDRRIMMPNGGRDYDSKYDPLWCKAEHAKIDKQFDDITGKDGYLTRLHKRIDNIWYLLVGIGVIGIANLLVNLYPK